MYQVHSERTGDLLARRVTEVESCARREYICPAITSKRGHIFGSYRVTDKLGVGSSGVVYEAEHTHIGRKAAIKVLLPEWTSNSALVERFFNEARSSARVKHTGIVEIFDCGFTDDGQAFLVMELLSGEPLHVLLAREGQLPVRRATDLVRQLAGALAAAHAQGIIHRDLKPDNVFVVPDRHAQTREIVKVLDFGVAKLAGDTPETIHGLLGTPLYMPPEQVAASSVVDARSDIYALGCMLFEMLCGRPPFVHDNPQTVATMQVREQPPRARQLRPDVPFNVDSLIARMLNKNPADRPQSMADLRAELDVAWSLLATPIGDESAALGPAVVRVSVHEIDAERGDKSAKLVVPVLDSPDQQHSGTKQNSAHENGEPDPRARSATGRSSRRRLLVLITASALLAVALGAALAATL